MAKTMKAAVVREFGKPLVIEETVVPTPEASQIPVKGAAAGVCHTDLHAAEGDWPVKPKPPFIPGHEGVGHPVAVGPGVKTCQGRRPWRRKTWITSKTCSMHNGDIQGRVVLDFEG